MGDSCDSFQLGDPDDADRVAIPSAYGRGVDEGDNG
jgi:hypothetical protein